MKKLILILFFLLFEGMLSAQVALDSINLNKFYLIRTNAGTNMVGKVIMKDSGHLTIARDGRIDLLLPVRIIERLSELSFDADTSENMKVRFNKDSLKKDKYYEIWINGGNGLIIGKVVFIDNVKLVIERIDYIKMKVFFINITSIEDLDVNETEWKKSYLKNTNTTPEIKQSNAYLQNENATKSQFRNSIFYIGGGKIYPGTGVKKNVFHADFTGFNISVFIPGSNSGVVKKISGGLHLGCEYFYHNDYDLNIAPAPYNIAGQLAPPSVDLVTGQSPLLEGFNFNFGLQFNILTGKNFVISPIFGIGELFFHQKSYEFVQSTKMSSGINSVKHHELLKQNETDVIPTIFSQDNNANCFFTKLRLQYISKKGFGVWTEANYSVGAKVYYTYVGFTPKGSPDQNGEYTLNQMDNGTKLNYGGSYIYQSLGLNIGIAYKVPARRK